MGNPNFQVILLFFRNKPLTAFDPYVLTFSTILIEISLVVSEEKIIAKVYTMYTDRVHWTTKHVYCKIKFKAL